MSVVYPLDFARTRMGADKGVGKDKQYKSMNDCLSQIYAKDGLSGLYQGFGMSLCGIVAYRAAYFGLYDVGKAVMYQPGQKHSPVKSLALAFTTDTFASMMSYPFDTVRRAMMMQAGKAEEDKQYKSAIDAARKIVAKEGAGGLYKGSLSNIARGLGGALVLVFYDQVKAKGASPVKAK